MSKPFPPHISTPGLAAPATPAPVEAPAAGIEGCEWASPAHNAPASPPRVTPAALQHLKVVQLRCRAVTGLSHPPEVTVTCSEHPTIPLFEVRAPSGALYLPLTGKSQLAGKGAFGAVMRYHCGSLAASDVALGLPPTVAVKTCFAGRAEGAPGAFNSRRTDRDELLGAETTRAGDAVWEGCVVASRIVLRATELGSDQLGERDPDAWSAVLMESADGCLWDLCQTRAAQPGALTAAEAAAVVRETARAALELLEADGLLHGDVKAGNVLVSRDGERCGGMRVFLCDLGGIVPCCSAGPLVHPPTFPVPGHNKDRHPRAECVPAWGCLALLLQLFQWRLVPGAASPAWRGLEYERCTVQFFEALVAGLEGAQYGADHEAAAIRDLFLAALPRQGPKNRPCPALLTLDGVIRCCEPLCGSLGGIGRLLKPQPVPSPPAATATAATPPPPHTAPATAPAAAASAATTATHPMVPPPPRNHPSSPFPHSGQAAAATEADDSDPWADVMAEEGEDFFRLAPMSR